jgi:hypothetical protein
MGCGQTICAFATPGNPRAPMRTAAHHRLFDFPPITKRIEEFTRLSPWFRLLSSETV